MKRMFKPLAIMLATTLAGITAGQVQASDAPKVVASIPPVHSLVASVMKGVGEPDLLIPGTASPHTFSLKPSDARKLSGAEIVVWIGPELETSLRGPLNALSSDAHLVTLTKSPGMELLEIREGGAWGVHDHDHGGHHDHGTESAEAHADHDHDHDHDHKEKHGDHAEEAHGSSEHDHDHGHDKAEHAHAHGSSEHAHEDDHDSDHAHEKAEHAHAHGDDAEVLGEIDAHIWLSTDNARAILAAVAEELIEHDPAHATTYAANRDAAIASINALEEDLRARLTPVSDSPFVVTHDGYQYFEHEFGLNAVGAITISPEVRPGVRRMAELREHVEEVNARCIFAEPQFGQPLVDTLAEGTGARMGLLDPIGADLQPGPELYGKLMENLAVTFSDCLAADG